MLKDRMDRRRLALLLVAIGAVAAISVVFLGARARRLDDVRASFGPDQRGAFDVLVALGGVGGDADWARAGELCRGLGWPRCDRPALEEMKASPRAQTGNESLQSAAARAVADLTWAFGNVESVKTMASAELARLDSSNGPARARVFLRFGIVDTNPDGQAALFSQACVADPSICTDPAATKRAAEVETRTRRVTPGNVLPLYFTGGHPPLPSSSTSEP
jgi:hypothetical protein